MSHYSFDSFYGYGASGPDLHSNHIQLHSHHFYYSHDPSDRSLICYSVAGPALSTAELDDSKFFSDYDSEPYGGGYDISATYGDSLPPSDEICYPRAFPIPSPEIPPHGSAGFPATVGEVVKNEPPCDREQKEVGRVAVPPFSGGDGEGEGLVAACKDHDDEETPLSGGDTDNDEGGDLFAYEEYYHYPWWGYGEDGFGTPGDVEGFDGCGLEKKPASGSDRKATDWCQGLLGYYCPCLFRRRQQQHQCQYHPHPHPLPQYQPHQYEFQYQYHQYQAGFEEEEGICKGGDGFREAANYSFGDSCDYQFKGQIGEARVWWE